MAKQTSLDWRGDRPARLWPRLPDLARRAVIEQYARLITRAAQARTSQGGKKR
jgi:hypothetical protein